MIGYFKFFAAKIIIQLILTEFHAPKMILNI